jgi:hypothetical protein
MGATGIRLEKALWTNIAELRLAENRRRRYLLITISVLAVLLAGVTILLLLR